MLTEFVFAAVIVILGLMLAVSQTELAVQCRDFSAGAAQPLLAESVRRGLQWRILSWKVRDEEGAREIIQSAANRKNQASMQETSLQAVARLSAACSKIESQGGRVDVAAAKRHLLQTMPTLAQSPEFLGLLRFVVNIGADGGPFIRDLKDFVGLRGQNRQLKAATFALAGQMPVTVPYVTIGLIIMAYTAPEVHFVDGFSRFLSQNDVRNLITKETCSPTLCTTSANAILRYFHLECAEAKAYDDMSNADRLDFLMMLDSIVCRSICGKHLGVRHDSCPNLGYVAESFLEELKVKGKLRARGLALPQTPWETPTEPPERPSSSRPRKEEPDLLPKIISFVSGQADSEQEIHIEHTSEETVDWAPTIIFPTEEVARARLSIALDELTQTLVPVMKELITLKRNGFGDLVVEAKTDLKAGSVALAPSVNGPGFIISRACGDDKKSKTLPPSAIDIPDWFGAPLAILPCAKMPPRGVNFGTWDKTGFVNPFWAMARSPIPEKANCSMTTVLWTSLTQLAMNTDGLELERKSKTGTGKGALPIIYNHRDITAGTELVLEVEPGPLKRPWNSKTFTWDSLKRHKQAAKA